MTETVRVAFGATERRGAWAVPERLAVRVLCGHCTLDLRGAELADDTTVELHVTMGSVEIVAPAELAVDVAVATTGASVERSSLDGARPPPGAKRLRVQGKVKLGYCDVIALRDGETLDDHARRLRHELRRRRHHRHHRHHRWRDLHAERELWRSHPDRSPWLPWWLKARMRRRIFTWLTIAFVVGVLSGVHLWGHRHPWHFALAGLLLFMASGIVAWRLTRPLFLVVQAARDIGDGRLDTRLDTHHGGEMKVLAVAINDMAERIAQQLADQRQLLAAVSHELRTPLGHMRVLVETARERGERGEAAGQAAALGELDRELTTLDDLVGKLLASSRLEFGSLDRRAVDLGELVGDVATSAGVAPERIEASDDVRAQVDPTLIRRAIANLLDNARVHGGGAVAVRVVRRGAQIAIEVDDAGPGVPADRRADAFRAFVPSSGGGLGLGLALVSRIAVAHDGGAWISDRPGGGARVGFTVAARPI